MGREQAELWHQSAIDDTGQSVYFKKYMYEYLALVAVLRVLNPRYSDDAQLLTDFKTNFIFGRKDVRASYLQRIEKNEDSLREHWNYVYTRLNEKRLENPTRRDNSFDYWNWTKPDDMGKLRSLDDWMNMVNYWRAIRNNLFHGSKTINDDRDIFLVEHGYGTLYPLVEILIRIA